MRHVCFGLMRFCGTLAFFAAGLGVFVLVARWVGIDDGLEDILSGKIEGKRWWPLIAGLVVGMIAGLVGQGIGASIPVRNEKFNGAITVVWHGFANGGIVWMFLSIVWFTIEVGGGEQAENFIATHGAGKMSLVVIGAGSVAGIVILLAHLGAAVRRAPAVAWLLSAGFGVGAGLLQARLLALGIAGGIVTGVVLSVGVALFSAHTLARDIRLREEARRGAWPPQSASSGTPWRR